MYPLPDLPLKQDLPALPNMDDLPPLPDLKELPPLNSHELRKLSDLPDLPPLPDRKNTHFSPKHSDGDNLILPKAGSDEDKAQTEPITNRHHEIKNTEEEKELIPHSKSIPKEIMSSKPVTKEYSTTLPPDDDTHKHKNDEHLTEFDVDKKEDFTNVGKMSMPDFKPDLGVIKGLTLNGNDKEIPEIVPMFRLKTTEEDGHSYKWKPLDWSDCSRNCGGGVRTRVVECLDVDLDTTVQQDLCDINTKPTAIEDCKQYQCASWLTSPWGECSSPCGHSVKHRLVTCQQNGMCETKAEPASEEICDVPKCVKWVSGQWSKCNKPCGGGEQLRLVQCIDISTQLRTQGCEYSEKPDERQDCNIDQCKDNNAALSMRCVYNEISSKLCRVLKRMGQCSNIFVALKCCKSCNSEAHRRANKDRPRSQSLR